MENYKEKDLEAILAYMKGKESVKVEDIIREAGADELRVYPLLFELEQEGKILVLRHERMGAAAEVKLA